MYFHTTPVRYVRTSIPAFFAVMLCACGSGSSPQESSTQQPTQAGQIAFASADYTVDEMAKTLVVTITRTGGADGKVSADVTAAGGSATPSEDFEALIETVVFGDGDSTDKTVTVTLKDDIKDEPDETIELTLAAVTGGASLGTIASAEAVILDDDPDERTIGITVSGLQGSGLVLRNNDSDELAAGADGQYTFSQTLFDGDTYHVTVSQRPWGPAQTCDIQNGQGTVDFADVTNVEVVCAAATLQSIVLSRRVTDGTTQQGDLYLVREDGEGLVRLTDTPVFEDYPVSTFGNRLVYRRERISDGIDDLDSVQFDGTGELLLTSSQPLSGFGMTARGILAYSANGDIFSADVTGLQGNDTLLTGPDEDRVVGVTGDGRIVFSRTNGADTDLLAIDIDGNNIAQLAKSPDPEQFVGATPSGHAIFRRIAGTQSDLYSVSLAGGNLNVIAEEPDADERVEHILGNSVVIVRREYGTGAEELLAVRADGSSSVRLAAGSNNIRFAAVAPGERILYTIEDATRQSDVYIVFLDGTGTLPLAATPDDESFAGFAPDGQAIITRVTGAQTDLAKVALDGSSEALIADGPEVEELIAAFGTGDDARLLIARAALVGGAELISIRADGSDARILGLVEEKSLRGIVVTEYGSVIFQDADGHLSRIGIDGNGPMPLTPFTEETSLQLVLADGP